MRVELNRIDDAFHMEAKNEGGNSVHLDGSPAIGGHDLGARPMELVLMGLGGCSAMDVISILKKQREPLKELRIVVDGERAEGEVPAVFQDIKVEFHLEGDLKPDKVKRAVSLSMETYCSVSRMLEKTAKISARIFLNGTELE